jgi:1-acyl-sn-glycerol-3-phosphate acyltransferase
LFHLLSRVHINGLENVPEKGAYVIAVNHVSLIEPPFVLAFWPVAAEAIGAVDVWDRPGQAILVRLYGSIKVHRGQYDRRVLETMLAVLRSGRPFLIAPEGGRTHTPGLRRAFPGAAYIVAKAGVPVLRRALKGERPPLEMNIGLPFNLPPVDGKGEDRRVALQSNADRIMDHIAALLPPEYRGVYSGHAVHTAKTAQPGYPE